MTAVRVVVVGFLFSLLAKDVSGQVSGNSLTAEIRRRPELSRYLSWLTRTQLEPNFEGSVRYSLFVPNNTAFEQMNAERRRRFDQLTIQELRNYVNSYAVYSKTLTTNSMTDNTYEKSNGPNQEKLFIAVKAASGGIAGVSQYFVNGARIVNADIQCSNGVIQIIDNIPDPVSNKFIYSYLQTPDIPSLPMTAFFRDLLLYLPESNYVTIPEFKTAEKVTLFVPSDDAIRKIPPNRLAELRQNAELLNQVITRHYIKDQAIHTSWVYHRQQFNTQLPGEKIMFRKIKTENYPEKVYVMSEGVNAEITFGNITVANGVIHVVDSLLGYKYNSAMEQINQDSNLNIFSGLLNTASAEIQNVLRNQQGSQQVTVFAPSNQAMADIQNLPGIDLQTNQTLSDMVIRYQVLEIGNALVVMDVNKQYENREMRRTMYQGKSVAVYQRYNETFVECGYVRARVLRPDVGVTNGYVQYIDKVFGVPSKDIPTTICEDRWLYKSFLVLQSTTLSAYLLDRRLNTGSAARRCQQSYQPNFGQSRNTFNNQNTPRPIDQITQNYNPNGNTNYQYDQNTPQQFTIFMTNGSALEYFEGTNLGRAIARDTTRYRWVLRRHIIPHRVIHMDTLAEGEHSYRTDTGEGIVVKKNGFGIRTYVEVIFGRKRAEVIHMDLGATNGVVHILNDFLVVEEDRTRDVSGSTRTGTICVTLIMMAAILAAIL